MAKKENVQYLLFITNISECRQINESQQKT